MAKKIIIRKTAPAKAIHCYGQVVGADGSMQACKARCSGATEEEAIKKAKADNWTFPPLPVGYDRPGAKPAVAGDIGAFCPVHANSLTEE